MILKHILRRADREAEGARLLSEYTPQGYLGFESPALRHLRVTRTLVRDVRAGVRLVSSPSTASV